MHLPCARLRKHVIAHTRGGMAFSQSTREAVVPDGMQGTDQITLTELFPQTLSREEFFIRCKSAIRIRSARRTYEAFVKDWRMQGRDKLAAWLLWMQHVNGYTVLRRRGRKQCRLAQFGIVGSG